MRLLLLLASLSWGQSTSEPQYFLPGEDYTSDSIAINTMFQNITGDIQRLKSSLDDFDSSSLLSSSNTWKYQNNFTTATVSGSLAVSTVTTGGNTIRFETLVASQSFTTVNASTISFPALVAGHRYTLRVDAYKAVANDQLVLRFNNDITDAHYQAGNHYVDSAGVETGDSDGSATYCYMTVSGRVTYAGDSLTARYSILPSFADSTKLIIHGDVAYSYNGGSVIANDTGCYVDLDANATSLAVVNISGTATGHLELLEEQ